jgi:antitoxin ParD1/3/4
MDVNGLPADLEQFVQQELARGKYQSRDEIIVEALTLFQEYERRRQQLQADIQLGLDQLDRGEYTEYDEQGLDELFERIKTEGRKKLASKPAS